jgi:hypothetical protein
LTLIEVLIVIAVLMVLAVVMLSMDMEPRAADKARRIHCANNLKEVGLGLRAWSADHKDKFPMEVAVTNGGSLEFVGTLETFRHFQVVSNELGTPKVLHCMADAKRVCATNFASDFNNSRLGYFIVATPPVNDPSAPLAGDRNLTVEGKVLGPGWYFPGTNRSVGWSAEIHKRKGNVLIADASVQQVTSNGVCTIFQDSSMATNRLSVP